MHAFTGLSAELTHSQTWDQGSEMGWHDEFTRGTNIPIGFCEPAGLWQRGPNVNTNSLLRQYFPRGTDLSIHSAEDLACVAAELNDRPRKILG
ncbi:IS30 family transposase [Streptomyces sp. MBT65]|nr:IS30 family transposase [Streptomyces sp. MBT65]